MIFSRRWRVYGAALRFAAIFGGVFGTVAGGVVLEPPHAGALFGLASAVADSLAVMALIGAMEIFVPGTRFGCSLAPRPFTVTVLVKFAAYLAVLVAVFGGRLGPRVATLAVSPETAAQFAAQIDAAFPRGLLVVVGGMIVFLLVSIRHLNSSSASRPRAT